MPRVSIKCGLGINRDQPPFELAPGVWSDCQNMRFGNGCDERVGGIASILTPSVIAYGQELFDVGTTSGTIRYLIDIGLTKVHRWDGTTETDITRGEAGPISTITGTGVTVTVTTSVAHGLTTGDNVIVTGVLPTGYNDTQNVTVTGATTFTYPNGTSAASTVTSAFWESNRTKNFTYAAGEEITSCVLNGVLYVNTLTDGLYYWGGSTSTGAAGRLRRLRTGTNGVNFVYGRSIAIYKDYLFVFGFLGNGLSATTGTGSLRKPYDIAWGSSAEPGSVPSTFSALATNDAGDVQKTRAGAIVHGAAFGETLFVFGEKGRLGIDYVGGNDVFSIRSAEGSDGLLAPNCIANTTVGQFFISQNRDLMVHVGGQAKSVANGRMLDYIRANIDSTNYARAFLEENKRRGEVWMCIPTTGNSTCSKALLYNYNDDAWGDRDLSGVTCGVAGMLPTTIATDERLVLSTTTPRIGLTESGTTDFGSTITSMVERTGIDFGDSSSVKSIQGTRWQFDGTAAQTGSVFHGAAMTADATPTYASAATVTLGTSNWVNAISPAGRYGAIKLTTTGALGKWRTVEADYSKSGDF